MTDAAEEVFADTGYWIAMHNPEDEWYRRAREAAASLANKRIVTSEMVLVEFLNFCSRSGAASRQLATITVRQLWDNPGIKVIPQDSAQLKAAVQRYADRLDQRTHIPFILFIPVKFTLSRRSAP